MKKKRLSAMTEEHFEQTLRELMSRKPFRVFTIELHGGRRFEVDDPTVTALRSGVAVFLAPGARRSISTAIA